MQIFIVHFLFQILTLDYFVIKFVFNLYIKIKTVRFYE